MSTVTHDNKYAPQTTYGIAASALVGFGMADVFFGIADHGKGGWIAVSCLITAGLFAVADALLRRVK